MLKFSQSNSKLITSSKLIDNLFINFPFWFPIAYVFLTLNYPSISQAIFISSLFLFAETHFATTWLFFFDKDNWMWLKKNSFKLVFLPLYTLSFICATWFISPSTILIMHYLASGWHVTKQSTGIINIYLSKNKFFKFLIYFFSFLCLFIGLKKPGILVLNLDLNLINIFILLLILIYFLIIYLSFIGKLSKNLVNFMTFSTGITIYLPLLFVNDLQKALAIGVGMHWCQYISIFWSTHLRKNTKNLEKKQYSHLIFKRIIFVFLYSLLMTILIILGNSSTINGDKQYSFLYLIPLVFQFYHFYIDGFIWKFSDSHIKNNVLQYLFKAK